MRDEEIIEELTYKLDMTEHQYFELIDKYNKQKEEIEALEIIHKSYKEEMKSIEDRYISKDKIKDRIEQLESYYDTSKETTPTSTNQFIIDVVAILEELLEE